MADQEKRRREDMQINTGFGQSSPAAEPSQRKPSLHQRLAGGEFRIPRAPMGDPGARVNVGMGGPTTGGAIDTDVTRPRPAAPALAAPQTAARAPTPAAPAVPPVAMPGRPDFGNVRSSVSGPSPVLQPGAANTFTGENLGTRRVNADGTVAPAANAKGSLQVMPSAAVQQQMGQQQAGPSGVRAPPSTAPAVQESVSRAMSGQRDLTRTTRADAAEFLNPMSNSAEIMRRFQNSQNSYFNKGSPQARRMAGEAILGQLGAQNQASATGQQAGNATLQQGVGFEAGANEGAARRQVDADMFNAQDSYQRDRLAAEVNRPTLQADAAGNLLSITGSTAAPVTSTDGSGVRMPVTAAGQVTPAALLDAYTSQAQAINESFGSPEEKANQQAALRSDPLYAPLFQASQPPAQRPPNAGEFIKAMRERGSKMTDAQLTAYYNQNYGK